MPRKIWRKPNSSLMTFLHLVASWMAFVVHAEEWSLDRVDRALPGRAQAVQDFQDCDDRGSFDICQLPSTRRPAHPSEHGFSHFTLLARVSPFFTCYMRGIRPAWFTHNLQTRSPRMPIGCGDVNPLRRVCTPKYGRPRVPPFRA